MCKVRKLNNIGYEEQVRCEYIHSIHTPREREREREAAKPREEWHRWFSLQFIFAQPSTMFYRGYHSFYFLFLISPIRVRYKSQVQFIISHIGFLLFFSFQFCLILAMTYDFLFFFNFFLICQIPETLPIFVIFINLRNLDYLQTG